jgi:CubicO group peptidase (beta-lactamase class C family)
MLDGQVNPNYAAVASALTRQIPKYQQAGSAVCVYHKGRCVVDLWGGIKDSKGQSWQADTTAPSFSTSKGVLSTLVHILVDQGLANYDDPIARYWPEFGARGKERISIRQALSHQAGLYDISSLVKQPAEMLDWEHMLNLIADAQPAHEPGLEQGYHALTYGWIVGGLIERLTRKSLQAVLQEELVDPLDLDGMYFGMPHNELYRRAELVNGISKPPVEREGWQRAAQDMAESALAMAGVRLDKFRSALMPFTEPFDWNDEATVQAKIPAANGQFTARSLAKMYAVLAEGGELDGVRLMSSATIAQLSEIQRTGRDLVLNIPMQWRLGYHRAFSFGVAASNAFGHYGYGGSGAFCDPSRRLAVALTLNSGAGTPAGDSRMPRMARAALRAVDQLR